MICPHCNVIIHTDKQTVYKNKTQIEQLIWIFNINVKLV